MMVMSSYLKFTFLWGIGGVPFLLLVHGDSQDAVQAPSGRDWASGWFIFMARNRLFTSLRQTIGSVPVTDTSVFYSFSKAMQ
jgi:hypothetical protein